MNGIQVTGFPRKTNRNKYHWAKYADGSVWKFTGRDKKQIDAMYYSARLWAVKHNQKLSTQREDLEFYIRFEKFGN